MKITTITFAALAASALLPVAALADTGRVEVSRNVVYRDLDLTNAAGREQLDRRLAVAVRNTCGSSNTRELRQLADVTRCRREAKATSTRGRELAIAYSAQRASVAMMATAVPKFGR